MRLKTKLVLTASCLTLAIVLAVSFIFVAEMLRQRVEQTGASSAVLANETLQMTRLAVESGLRANPPSDRSAEALHAAVVDALRSSDALLDVMNAIVRYSPTVEDVSVTDAYGTILVSSDPETLNLPATQRLGFVGLHEESLPFLVRQLFGRSRVLDVSAPLDRNNMPFLVIHIGVRSSFLRNSFAPGLRTALVFALLAAFVSMIAAALITAIALRPLKTIGEQLERLSDGSPAAESASPLLAAPRDLGDALGLVNSSIDRLGRQMQSREAGYTALQTNLDHMLDTLRDGVLLFNAERRAVMVSDAVANFLPGGVGREVPTLVGLCVEEIFLPDTALGAAFLQAFATGLAVAAQTVTLEDGRQVQISLDPIDDAGLRHSPNPANMGTLLTLRDTGSASEIEQEIEVSRRLAAIGRLTAGVGHEVKNPINAMVVHLELLRGKLAASAANPGGRFDRDGAQRHVEILTDEMRRLDRVVETLADFTRPLDLHLHEQDLRSIVDGVVELTGAEIRDHGIGIHIDDSPVPVMVRVDAEFIRQALLNLMLNAVQAMPSGGTLRVCVRREHRHAVIDIADNGVGIPDHLLPRIFDLYFTTKPRGSGIGLAMTYRILQLHGGAMDVRSNADPHSPERGTTFILHLPVSDTRSANASQREPSRIGAFA